MGMIRLRLAEKDWPDYARGDEWFQVDAALPDLDDLTWDDIDAVEQEYAAPIASIRPLSARHLRLLLWIARRRGGVTEPFGSFKPSVYRLETQDVDPEPAPAGDADPPVGSAAAPTPPDSATTSRPARRSSTSTPRSRASGASRRGKSAS